MDVLHYILPFIFLILTVLGFFIEVNQPKGKIILIVVILISAALIAGEMYLISAGKKLTIAAEENVKLLENWKTGQVARLSGVLATLRTEATTNKDKVGELINLGWTNRHPLFTEARNADLERRELLNYIPPPNNVVTIENLPNNVDKMIVSWSIEELGHVVRAPQKQEFLESDNNENSVEDNKEEITEEKQTAEQEETLEEANVMYYGHLVRNNDIKLIAYSLIRSGVQIRMFKSFKQKSAENARSVRFDWSKIYRKREAISVEKIKNTKRFKR